MPPLRILSLLAAIIWIALEFYLSSQSTLPSLHLFVFEDKVIHAIYYGVLAVFFLGSFHFTAPDFGKKERVSAVLLASMYGVFDEIHQLYVPGRYADIWDWVADTSGAILAVGLLSWGLRRYWNLQRRGTDFNS
ncbi:MAG: VanZ family protein [Gammaproteobacteria bacterium]